MAAHSRKKSKIKEILSKDFFKRYDKGIWVITLVSLLNSAGFAICLPFLSLYLHQERELPMTAVGALILIGGLVASVGQMIGGALSDRYGRKPILVWMSLATVILYSLLAVAIQTTTPIWIIGAIYVGTRATLMAVRPSTSAVIADLAPRGKLTEAYGLLRVGANLGWAMGPAIGGFVLVSLQYSWLFAFAGLTGLCSLGLIWFLLKETHDGSYEKVTLKSIGKIASNKSFVAFTAITFLTLLVMGQMLSTLSIYTVDRVGFTAAQYGFLLTLNGIIVFTLQYPVARFLSGRSKYKILLTGSLLYAVGYLMFGWVGPYGLALFGITLVTIGEIISAPTAMAVVSEIAPRNQRGRYMGFYTLSETLGFSMGPLIGGVLLDTLVDAPVMMWGIIAIFGVISAAGYFIWGKLSWEKRVLQNTR